MLGSFNELQATSHESLTLQLNSFFHFRLLFADEPKNSPEKERYADENWCLVGEMQTAKADAANALNQGTVEAAAP